MERAAGNGGYKGSRTDEDRLLLLMKTGDMEAFRRLYELTAKGIYSYALSILQQPQDAEEVKPAPAPAAPVEASVGGRPGGRRPGMRRRESLWPGF